MMKLDIFCSKLICVLFHCNTLSNATVRGLHIVFALLNPTFQFFNESFPFAFIFYPARMSRLLQFYTCSLYMYIEKERLWVLSHQFHIFICGWLSTFISTLSSNYTIVKMLTSCGQIHKLSSPCTAVCTCTCTVLHELYSRGVIAIMNVTWSS